MTPRKEILDVAGLVSLFSFLDEMAEHDKHPKRVQLFKTASNQAWRAAIATRNGNRTKARMQLEWCRRNAKRAIAWAADDMGIPVPLELRP